MANLWYPLNNSGEFCFPSMAHSTPCQCEYAQTRLVGWVLTEDEHNGRTTVLAGGVGHGGGVAGAVGGWGGRVGTVAAWTGGPCRPRELGGRE